jgi:hypothetical protein
MKKQFAIILFTAMLMLAGGVYKAEAHGLWGPYGHCRVWVAPRPYVYVAPRPYVYIAPRPYFYAPRPYVYVAPRPYYHRWHRW